VSILPVVVRRNEADQTWDQLGINTTMPPRWLRGL